MPWNLTAPGAVAPCPSQPPSLGCPGRLPTHCAWLRGARRGGRQRPLSGERLAPRSAAWHAAVGPRFTIYLASHHPVRLFSVRLLSGVRRRGAWKRVLRTPPALPGAASRGCLPGSGLGSVPAQRAQRAGQGCVGPAIPVQGQYPRWDCRHATGRNNTKPSRSERPPQFAVPSCCPTDRTGKQPLPWHKAGL